MKAREGFKIFEGTPFGMVLPGRDTYDPQYKYGFNGKENELDFRGIGRITDYGMRTYDARLGRFSSFDPLQKAYPMLSPYQYAGNSPVSGIDLDGLEFRYYNLKNEPGSDGNTHLGINKNTGIADRTIKVAVTVNWLSRPEILIPGNKLTAPVYGFTDQWNFGYSFKMSDIKLSPVVVSPDGKMWRVLPDNFDLDDLPALSDPIWNMLETPDEFISRKATEGNEVGKKAVSYAQAINLITGIVGKKSNSKPDRYDGPKPKYHVNPKHIEPKDPKITPLPKDAEDVFRNAVPGDPINPKHWYGKNKEGAIYRFSDANNGTAHFSGRSDYGEGIPIDKYVKERLGLNKK